MFCIGAGAGQGLEHDGHDVLTPNQRLVTLDAAHASKRFLSRTFKCDEKINSWLQTFVLGSSSIVSVIENSHVFSEWFKAAVATTVGKEYSLGGEEWNLGMAKHRYISIKKRLGRLIGKFSAVFAVAEKIRVARPGKAEASHAEAFLREFGEEQFLQLAMLADASDEAYVYTMFADDEGMDIALQAEEVASFVDHIRYLFNDDEGCLAIDGYTKFAREQLQKVRVVNMAKDLPPALPSSSAIIPQHWLYMAIRMTSPASELRGSVGLFVCHLSPSSFAQQGVQRSLRAALICNSAAEAPGNTYHLHVRNQHE
jgi:hypothetical protein